MNKQNPTNSKIKNVMSKIAEVQADMGVACAGLEEIGNCLDQLSDNFAKQKKLIEGFKL